MQRSRVGHLVYDGSCGDGHAMPSMYDAIGAMKFRIIPVVALATLHCKS